MRPVLIAVLALSMAAPQIAVADGGPRILVLDPKGTASWGGPIVAKAIRKKLEDSSGAPVSQKDYAKALKATKSKGTEPADIAKAGKEAGADYVLVLTITKKGWQFTANAVLINASSGEQQMDFKSGYFKPKVEGADRGERIARVTLEKIAALGGVASVSPPPPARDTPPPPPPPVAKNDPPTPPIARNDPPPPSKDRIEDPPPNNDRLEDPPPAAKPVASASPTPAYSPSSSASASSSGSSSARPNQITEPMDGGRAEKGQDILHAAVGGGAGVLHTYDLKLSDGRPSQLSYQTDPLSLMVADLEVLIPMIKTGVFAHVAFSPIRFVTKIGATETQPSGTLFDMNFGLKAHFALSGEGREAIELAPYAGLRLNILGVADHPSSLIHGSTSIAPFVGAELRLPFAGDFEAVVGADFAFVVGYSESPSQSRDGDLASGIQFGAGLGLRFWLTDAVGVAFDGRFDLRSLDLSGSSLRQQPPGEDLEDVSVGNRDLRFSLGVAFRI